MEGYLVVPPPPVLPSIVDELPETAPPGPDVVNGRKGLNRRLVALSSLADAEIAIIVSRERFQIAAFSYRLLPRTICGEDRAILIEKRDLFGKIVEQLLQRLGKRRQIFRRNDARCRTPCPEAVTGPAEQEITFELHAHLRSPGIEKRPTGRCLLSNLEYLSHKWAQTLRISAQPEVPPWLHCGFYSAAAGRSASFVFAA